MGGNLEMWCKGQHCLAASGMKVTQQVVAKVKDSHVVVV